MDVAITGAAGEIGKHAVDALDAYEPSLFTHSEQEGLDSSVLDVTDEAAFRAALGSEDVLVHLAWADAAPEGWNEDHEANVRGTYNALEAARHNDLDRVVLPSSIHAVGMYNRDDPVEMESVARERRTAVDPGARPRPDSFYGVAKVATEGLGSFYADRYGLEVVLVRIGWVMSPEELREMSEMEDERYRFALATWLSPRDCRNVLDCAVTAEIAENQVTVFATSANDERYTTLTGAMVHLDYRPRDNATVVADSAER